MLQNKKYSFDMNSEWVDTASYRHYVGKLIYLTITRPNISYCVGVVSQFMQKS